MKRKSLPFIHTLIERIVSIAKRLPSVWVFSSREIVIQHRTGLHEFSLSVYADRRITISSDCDRLTFDRNRYNAGNQIVKCYFNLANLDPGNHPVNLQFKTLTGTLIQKHLISIKYFDRPRTFFNPR
jgi:hypothetical protein